MCELGWLASEFRDSGQASLTTASRVALPRERAELRIACVKFDAAAAAIGGLPDRPFAWAFAFGSLCGVVAGVVCL